MGRASVREIERGLPRGEGASRQWRVLHLANGVYCISPMACTLQQVGRISPPNGKPSVMSLLQVRALLGAATTALLVCSPSDAQTIIGDAEFFDANWSHEDRSTLAGRGPEHACRSCPGCDDLLPVLVSRSASWRDRLRPVAGLRGDLAMMPRLQPPSLPVEDSRESELGSA